MHCPAPDMRCACTLQSVSSPAPGSRRLGVSGCGRDVSVRRPRVWFRLCTECVTSSAKQWSKVCERELMLECVTLTLNA